MQAASLVFATPLLRNTLQISWIDSENGFGRNKAGISLI